MRRVNCKGCGVKNEKLAFLSDNTKYTLRFAMQIGGLCRAMTIKDVAKLMRLDWHAVKDLDKIYMREQLRVAGPSTPSVIGVDEISIKKGHSYRIIVSDLEARRAIWFGGKGRTEADPRLREGRHGFVFRVFRQEKQPENQACRDGHVEGFS